MIVRKSESRSNLYPTISETLVMLNDISNIIKGKIQHDQTFAVAAATANQFNKCNVAKSLGVWLEVG